MFRVVFFGTADFGVPLLEALANREDVSVEAVITRPDRPAGRGRASRSPPVADRARARNLPLFQPEDPAARVPEILASRGGLDLGVLAAYGVILPPEVFELPRHGVFNFHASLLPRWRGASPIRHALLAGDAETGVTVFRVVEALDAGPVSHRFPVPIGEGTTYGELYERLRDRAAQALDPLLEDLAAGELRLEPQQGEATYAPRIDTRDARIDWNDSAAAIDRHVRAFCPAPGAFTFYGERRIKLFEVRPLPDVDPEARPPGTVLSVGEERFRVGAGEGAVDVLEIQPAGSRRMSVRDYLAGNPNLTPGDRFRDEARTVD